MQGNKKIYDLKSLNFLRNISIAKTALINDNLVIDNNRLYKISNHTKQCCNPRNNRNIEKFENNSCSAKSVKIGVLGGSFI